MLPEIVEEKPKEESKILIVDNDLMGSFAL